MGIVETTVWSLWFMGAVAMMNVGINEDSSVQTKEERQVDVLEGKLDDIDVMLDLEKGEVVIAKSKSKGSVFEFESIDYDTDIQIDYEAYKDMEYKEEYGILHRIAYKDITENDTNLPTFLVEKDGKEYIVKAHIEDDDLISYVNDKEYQLFNVRSMGMVEIDLEYDYKELGNDNEKRLLYILVERFEFHLEQTLDDNCASNLSIFK